MNWQNTIQKKYSFKFANKNTKLKFAFDKKNKNDRYITNRH